MNENECKDSTNLLEEYKKVVDAGAIVSKADLEGKITYANDQFCKISGYTREELIGSNHNIVRHPDVPAATYADLWSTIKRKETWKGKVKNRAKDGSAYYVKVVVVPILDNDDNIIEYLALRQDVSELEELNMFLEKRVSEEVEKNRKKDEQSIAMLDGFLENSPNPIVVYSGLDIQYANSNFIKLTTKTRDEIIRSSFALDSLFDDKVGYIKKQDEIDIKIKTNKVSISTSLGRNIFYILVDEISFLDNLPSKMYTFNNITLIEYQKLKISHYNERMEDFVKRIYIKKDYFQDSTQEVLQDSHKLDETPKEKRVLSRQEQAILKRSRENVAVSSSEYREDIDDYILEDIDELSEIEAEMSELMALFNEGDNFNILHEIPLKLFKYSSTVSLLIEFEDLAYAIKSLAELLQTVRESETDKEMHKKIELYLSNILLDLSSWRQTIFVDQVANDIHYLDSSLFSTILQFELIFNKVAIEENDDDFELF